MLKLETNIGHVEMYLRGDELSIEHYFSEGNKSHTKRINMDRKETKQLLKLLKSIDSEN